MMMMPRRMMHLQLLHPQENTFHLVFVMVVVVLGQLCQTQEETETNKPPSESQIYQKIPKNQICKNFSNLSDLFREFTSPRTSTPNNPRVSPLSTFTIATTLLEPSKVFAVTVTIILS